MILFQRILFYYLSALFLFLFGSPAFSQNKETFQIPYSNRNITIDADLSDWGEYFEFSFDDTLRHFISPSGYDLKNIYPKKFDFSKIKKPKSRNKVRVQIFWNTENLCIGFLVWDKHLFAEAESRDDKPLIHLNDGIEIYIDTQNDSPARMDINDYQFIINLKNESVVLRGDRKEILANSAVPKDFAQNVLFLSSVKYIGEINNEAQEDSLYIVEIVIPFAAIGLIPKTGKKMRLDLCINDVDYFRAEGYEVEEISSNNWTFNWAGYSDFGYPDYWKTVRLSGEPSWLDSFLEKHKREWLWIYLATLIVSLFAISFLFYRTHKLRQIPTHTELDNKRVIFINKDFNDEILSHNQKILKSVSEFISKNPGGTIHSEDAAEHAGISLRTLQRITKEEMNITPTSYICVIKLKLAAEYLKNKQGNVTEAAYEFGFSDPAYFSKLFKRHFGISPLDYVKSFT